MAYIVGEYATIVGFARALKVAFQHNSLYRWDPNSQYTKISIYDEYPLARIQYPAVIVSSAGGPALLRGMGDEIAQEITEPVFINGATHNEVTGVLYAGNLRPTVNIRIMARSAYDRAQIADWIDLFIRHFAPKKFAKEGVLIEDVVLGPQVVTIVGADPLYESSISVRCLTAFNRVLNNAEFQTINAMCITGIFSILPDGATTS